MTSATLRLVEKPTLTVDRLKAVFEARFDDDAERFAAAFAEDGVLIMPGLPGIMPFAGRHQGRAAIADVIARASEVLKFVDGAFVDIVIDDRLAFARRHMIVANGDGGQREFEIVDLIRHRDGLILEMEQFTDTAGLAIFAGWVR